MMMRMCPPGIATVLVKIARLDEAASRDDAASETLQ